MSVLTASNSLYLHIPFCTVRCTYCAFNTYINLESLIEPFTNALIREIEFVARSHSGLRLHTIYFGGGTPSLLSHTQIGRILSTVRREFDLDADAEISMEANPDDIHIDYVLALMEQGINRLSLGMQSANNRELQLFGRRHDADTIHRAVAAARRAGLKTLNLDLIFGIPHQTLSDWEVSLNQLLVLHPEHLSIYALGLEDGTAMNSWVQKGKLPLPDDDLTADMYEFADEYLNNHGYQQYEISNWSLPSRECKHNKQYWLNLPYLGLGPGAHGYMEHLRYETILSPHRYINLLTNSDASRKFPLTPAVNDWHEIDRDTEIAETLLMGLRLTQTGINRFDFVQRFGSDVMDYHGSTIEKFAESGLLILDDKMLKLSPKGRFLSNMIFREFV
jgi:oxygen-independent coproporphyrinogen III oxidase